MHNLWRDITRIGSSLGRLRASRTGGLNMKLGDGGQALPGCMNIDSDTSFYRHSTTQFIEKTRPPERSLTLRPTQWSWTLEPTHPIAIFSAWTFTQTTRSLNQSTLRSW